MGVSNCIYRSTKVVTLSFYWACKYEPLGSAVTSVVPTLKLKATVQRYCKRSTKQGPGRAGSGFVPLLYLFSLCADPGGLRKDGTDLERSDAVQTQRRLWCSIKSECFPRSSCSVPMFLFLPRCLLDLLHSVHADNDQVSIDCNR